MDINRTLLFEASIALNIDSYTNSNAIHIIKYEILRNNWRLLEKQGKQKRRKLYLSEIDKMDDELLYMYYENLVHVYEFILIIIEKIAKRVKVNLMDSTDPKLLLAWSLLLIEIEHIDASIDPEFHLPNNVFDSIEPSIQEAYPDLKFSTFCKSYEKMYKYWIQLPNAVGLEIIKPKKKVNVFQSLYNKLLQNDNKNYEEISLILEKELYESWKALGPWQKQKRRKNFLALAYNRRDNVKVNIPYYQKMIDVYYLILNLLLKLSANFYNADMIDNADMVHLRTCSIALISKDYMDDYILPKHHLKPHFFETLAEDYDTTYPDLQLSELAKAYAEMYELWPDKPENNRQTS